MMLSTRTQHVNGMKLSSFNHPIERSLNECMKRSTIDSITQLTNALGGSLVPRAGLSVSSPRPSTQATPLRAFHYYPCRTVVNKVDAGTSVNKTETNKRLINKAFGFFDITRLIMICLFLFVNYAQAQVRILPLDSVLLLVDKQNLMLQEYDHKIKALNTYSEGAKSWMAPMIGAGTFMTPYPGQMVMEDRDKGSVMVSVEQEIPNPAKLNANKKFLQSRASVEEQGRAYQYNILRAEAKQLYYQWVVAEKKMRVLQENERIISLMLKLARIRYPYNQGSLGNVYKAEGRLSEVQNMRLMTQGDIDEKQVRLKSLMNLPHEITIMIDTSTQVHYSPEQLLPDTAVLSSQRSDVQQIEKTILVMQLNQQLMRQQAKPDFKIRFDHMQPLGDMPTVFTAMAMVSIPIAPWSNKMYKSETKGMQYDIDAMKKGREALLTEARGMIVGMSFKLSRMNQQLENYRLKIIPALEKNYQTLMLAYEENREQLPAVIDGWEAMSMAQMEYLNKQEEYYLMIVNYEKELEK